MSPHAVVHFDEDGDMFRGVTRDARIFGGVGFDAHPSYAAPAEYARMYGNRGPPPSPQRRR